jgi:hypothetical protein
MHKRVTTTFDDLNEARTLCALLGPSASVMSWVQPKDPWMAVGLSTGALIDDVSFLRHFNAVDATIIEELAARYFRIKKPLRHAALRVPLERLDRSTREFDLTDKSIDLGIALEALLLHDNTDKDRGELGYRLRLRGAWLGGNDPQERREIEQILRDAYDLRSRAVHLGLIEQTPENVGINSKATELCRRLIRKTIDADARINWGTLVLGAPAGEA